jgi:Domain of unknown function (DU1801)
MKSNAKTPEEFIANLPEDQNAAVTKLRGVILENIPKGFEEQMTYGYIGYVVPHSIYPKGYHCDPKLPLGFVSIASQKNFVSLHHMGLYGNPKLLEWFVGEYPKHSKLKLDMGKGCVRFKKLDQIPYDLIGELMQKVTVEEWINCVETVFTK